MASPQGEPVPESPGCVLAFELERRLVWRDGLGPGFRLKSQSFMTAEISLEHAADGTAYRVVARHQNPADRLKHQDMVFFQGWSTCLDQLEALAATL
ncbi:SRPBCC domain-containing protein [Frateuria aurantia]